MIRRAVFPPEYVLRLVGKFSHWWFAGMRVSLMSKRYLNYKEHGLKCVSCGLVGTRMALEKHYSTKGDKYHFNLYAINEHGSEVLMTVDHIIPKSRGGSNKLDNLQTMCSVCNNKKADRLPGEPKRKVKPKHIGNCKKIEVGTQIAKRSGKKFKNGEYVATVVGILDKKVPASNGGPKRGTYKTKKFLQLADMDAPVPERCAKAI